MHLDPRLRVRIDYLDETPFGSAAGARCDDVLRAACTPIVELWKRDGIQAVVQHGEALLRAARADAGGLGRYFVAPDRLHPDFLRPDPARVRPHTLSLWIDDERPPIQVPYVPDLARWFAAWTRDAHAPAAPAPRALFDALTSLGAFTDAPLAPAAAPLGDVTVVGHACVRFAAADGDGGVVVDPWMVPGAPEDTGPYQPLAAHELGHVRGVLLTHAHPDHFDPSTLLRFGADTPIVVPYLERETVLAVDMAYRLRELGFTDLRMPKWGESLSLAGLTVHVRPFYGEQPATDEVLHPEIRNAGNTYVIHAPYGRFALTVDSGRDPLGDARLLARRAHAELGPVDVLFAGCRGFGLYPVHYLFSSVARYLPFVPPSSWSQRQRIMNDADDGLDVAELWGAPRLVPYADGGAPWHWRLGLGPVLDGLHTPLASVDPAPEHVLLARALRSGSSQGAITSPIDVEVLRPNDRLTARAGRLERVRPVAWPYPPVPGLPATS